MHKQILILGGGFAGVEVLKGLQKEFSGNSDNVEITLVSKDNFFLFTPMLHEVSTGMIETRHIATAIRDFCKRARFYNAEVESIDLKNRQITLRHLKTDKGLQEANSAWLNGSNILKYDYLVVALGSKTKFHGLEDVRENAFTMKDLGDAIILRNHIISMFEQAEFLQNDNVELKEKLMTFVVVGGGFGGIESVGALNGFLQETIKKNQYHSIRRKDIRVVLIASGGKLLPEMGKELGEFALQKLKEDGVEVLLNTDVKGAGAQYVKLHDGEIIPTCTLLWSAGVAPERVVLDVPCKHDKTGRIVTNGFLEVEGYDNVYALGDCASIPNPNTGKTYPPTAQHALREARVVAKNIISSIGEKTDKNKSTFNYETKGVMATIGKRKGVAILFGIKLHGFLAWWIWRMFYLGNLPTIEKKARVAIDWSVDLLFGRDATKIKRRE